MHPYEVDRPVKRVVGDNKPDLLRTRTLGGEVRHLLALSERLGPHGYVTGRVERHAAKDFDVVHRLGEPHGERRRIQEATVDTSGKGVGVKGERKGDTLMHKLERIHRSFRDRAPVEADDGRFFLRRTMGNVVLPCGSIGKAEGPVLPKGEFGLAGVHVGEEVLSAYVKWRHT